MNKKLALAVLIIHFLVGDAYGMTAGEWMKKYKKPDCLVTPVFFTFSAITFSPYRLVL